MKASQKQKLPNPQDLHNVPSFEVPSERQIPEQGGVSPWGEKQRLKCRRPGTRQEVAGGQEQCPLQLVLDKTGFSIVFIYFSKIVHFGLRVMTGDALLCPTKYLLVAQGLFSA